MRKYDNEPYLRAEDLLRDGGYLSVELEVETVLTDAPLTRKLRPTPGFALAFKGREKVLGLGPTNESIVKTILGDARLELAEGKKFRIEVRIVRGQKKGETQPAIRIIPPSGTMMRSGLIRELGEPAPKPQQQPKQEAKQ